MGLRLLFVASLAFGAFGFVPTTPISRTIALKSTPVDSFSSTLSKEEQLQKAILARVLIEESKIAKDAVSDTAAPLKKKTRKPKVLNQETKIDFFGKTMSAMDGPTISNDDGAAGGRYRNKGWATSSATFRP